MKILVTGATGFIGRRLVEALFEDGHTMVCQMRDSSDTSLLEKIGVRLVNFDLKDAGATAKAIGEEKPDVVFHSAALVWDDDLARLMDANATGTRNLCEACYGHGVEKLIYLSTIAVISGNPEVPLTDELPYKTSNNYGRSKAEAERIVMDYRSKGLKAAVIRPCIVYGEDEPHALDRIFKAICHRRVPVLDIPEMDGRFNLVYVGNVVKILKLALEKDEALEGTFIVTDIDIITFRRFLEIVYDEFGVGPPPVVPGWLSRMMMVIPPFRRKVNDFLKERLYDTSRAVEMLGYDPEISTEEGLRRTVRYWKRKSHV